MMSEPTGKEMDLGFTNGFTYPETTVQREIDGDGYTEVNEKTKRSSGMSDTFPGLREGIVLNP